jgi:hypothetical protein
MSSLPGFLTHYFEADKGPFRNICDLPDQEIEAEKHAGTAFNRFALGPNFFKIRRAADDLLIEKYTEKFGVKPQIRPYFAVLGLSIEPRPCIETPGALRSAFHFYRRSTLLLCIRTIFIWFGAKSCFARIFHTPISLFMICFSPTLNCRRQ